MSRAEILYQGMTEIDDDLIEMAQQYHATGHRQWIKWGGYSICAAIIAAVLLILPMSRVTVEDPGVIREESGSGLGGLGAGTEGLITDLNGSDAHGEENAPNLGSSDVKPGRNDDLAAKKDPDEISKMLAQTEQGEDILILNHVGAGMTELKIDGQCRSLNDKWSPEAWERMEQEFESMLGIGYAEFQASIFPGEADAWVNQNAYALYTRSAKFDDPEEYHLYHYAFVYVKATGAGTARVAVSAPWSPLTDYYLDEAVLEPEKSVINGAQLYIYEWQNRWFTSFEWQGICYEVETTDLTEEEMVKLIRSLMASGAHHASETDSDSATMAGLADGKGSTPQTAQQTEDVPVDESTYHEARTYSAEIMDLQERISQGMVDGELPFVIESAIYENPDRIVVTVTTQDEAFLAQLRNYDTVGGLLEIKYAGKKNGAATEELLNVLE
ncbi:MAG: DUF4367 domain-containing protein [Lachnospiraceae bacterium]|nr:DUF4367 domain-containing protein [Lachnospiraceae bacterium]